jgi:hypothetical protein
MNDDFDGVEYYAASPHARRAVEALLGLAECDPRSDADWEIIVSDPSLVKPLLESIEGGIPDLETRAAAFLLLFFSLGSGVDLGWRPDPGWIERIQMLLSRDPQVLARMRFYFIINDQYDWRRDLWTLLLVNH